MIRRFVFSLFAFAVLSSFGADPIYYSGCDSVGDFSGYAWVPSFADVVSALSPDFVPSDWDPNMFVDPNDPYSINYLVPISPDIYFECLDDSPYRPFSSDPAYSSHIPSNPPSGGGGGGGGSPSGGGGGEGDGGFDPVGSFGGLPSFMSGLASVALGLFAIASGILLTFLVFRKVRYSSKRI